MGSSPTSAAPYRPRLQESLKHTAMKTGTKRRGPLGAWLLSLPLALGCPTALWLIAGIFGQEPVTLIVAGVALLVHLVAYLVTGLPIFLRCFRNASSSIWRPQVGVPVGALLGVLGMLFLGLLLRRSADPLENPALYLLGGGYGVVTAIAALIQRPNLQTI